MCHQNTRVAAVWVQQLGAGYLVTLVVQLRGCEAICWDGLCGEAQCGALQGWISASWGVEVGRVTDAEGAVLVAPDGIGV